MILQHHYTDPFSLYLGQIPANCPSFTMWARTNTHTHIPLNLPMTLFFPLAITGILICNFDPEISCLSSSSSYSSWTQSDFFFIIIFFCPCPHLHASHRGYSSKWRQDKPLVGPLGPLRLELWQAAGWNSAIVLLSQWIHSRRSAPDPLHRCLLEKSPSHTHTHTHKHTHALKWTRKPREWWV